MNQEDIYEFRKQVHEIGQEPRIPVVPQKPTDQPSTLTNLLMIILCIVSIGWILGWIIMMKIFSMHDLNLQFFLISLVLLFGYLHFSVLYYERTKSIFSKVALFMCWMPLFVLLIVHWPKPSMPPTTGLTKNGQMLHIRYLVETNKEAIRKVATRPGILLPIYNHSEAKTGGIAMAQIFSVSIDKWNKDRNKPIPNNVYPWSIRDIGEFLAQEPVLKNIKSGKWPFPIFPIVHKDGERALWCRIINNELTFSIKKMTESDPHGAPVLIEPPGSYGLFIHIKPE